MIQRQREEDERQDRAEKERRERQAQENAEREQRQKEERERRERDDRERKEQEEQERRAREDQNRLTNDAAEREKRRQKDLLLQRMRVIDESRMKDENDPFMVPETRKSDKKDYGFTEPIKNMHNGKPAYDNVKVPVLERTKKKGFFDGDDDEVGGYQPSFTGTKGSGKQKNRSFLDSDSESGSSKGKRKPQQSDKKSNLMDNLFGGSSSNQNNINQSAGRSPQKERSSTALFGGGNAIIDDDEAPPRSNAHLLPRRTRQPATTISSRPTVNEIDDLDDLEEVVL